MRIVVNKIKIYYTDFRVCLFVTNLFYSIKLRMALSAKRMDGVESLFTSFIIMEREVCQLLSLGSLCSPNNVNNIILLNYLK